MTNDQTALKIAYAAFTIGSPGFCRYISDHATGLCISRTEAAAIAAQAGTAAKFLDVWTNEELWQDCHNGIDAD
jgi:hypothetical protein